MQENLNIIDKNVRVIEKIIDEAKEDIINEINKRSQLRNRENLNKIGAKKRAARLFFK